jgi:hypothetical protein
MTARKHDTQMRLIELADRGRAATREKSRAERAVAPDASPTRRRPPAMPAGYLAHARARQCPCCESCTRKLSDMRIECDHCGTEFVAYQGGFIIVRQYDPAGTLTHASWVP